MGRKKIVITGIGALAPNGNNVNQFWTNLSSGVSGIRPITYFDSSNHKVKVVYKCLRLDRDSHSMKNAQKVTENGQILKF